ncbi:MAG TPA: IPT/TIG domain-containing protein [Methylomirabilota bacterium]|nr:IPT/TIG domain-containing protein [Methylomirabilota bacterium]
MRALTATPNQLTAMLGPVPPGAVPGPIGVACGFFRRGTFVAGFNDLVVGDGGWFFVSPQVGVMAPGNITPVPIPPPSPNTRWYHSLPPSNGVVCLYLSNSCPRNTKIEIDGHFTIGGATNNLRHIDCWMPPIIYKRGGSALDCLRRVCDAFKCAFKQKFGVTLSCSAVPVPGGAKLVLTYPAGMIVNGGVTVCVTPGPGPRIDLVTPTSGEPGEILTIRGAGFGQNPDDVCSVLDDGGGRLIGLNVLSVQDDEIRAALPEIPAFAGGKPHQLKVVIGEGARPRIVPDFDDVQVNENPWTWVGAPQGAAMAVLPVVPRFVPSNQLCLQSPPPSNGVLTLVIDRDWERGQRVCIGARIHKPTDNGSDINFGGITFTGSGTRFDCAVRICDLLKKAFAARGREVNCNVTAQGGNALIRLSCAGVEPLNAGYISVCYKPNLPVVTAVDNPIVFPGDILTVRGRFFPPNPDDLCFVADLRGRLLGLEVLEVQDDPVEGGFIRARVPFIPEFAANQPHQLKIGVGQGVRPHIVPEFGDVVVAAAPWAWAGHPANMVAVNAEIIPRFRPDPLPGFHSLPPSNGVICVVIDQDWGSNMVVCIGARIHKPSDNGHDINFSDVVFTGSGTRFDCAVRICSLLKQTFAARGRLINCHVTAVGENAKITMSCAGPEPLNAGFIDIRIKQPVVPPIIQEVFPLEGGEGDIVTIFGQGFGDVPGNVCAVQRFGDRANPMEVLSVQDDRITARLGFVPPDAFAGEIMVAVGRGVFGRFTPKFDDIIADDDVWVWQRLRPGGVARVPFRPIPTPPLPGVQWFTERLVNGKLETIIEGSWVPGTFVWVQARAHSATVGLDLSAPRCRFVGAGTALQCAERMKDIIACAFLQQAGVNVIVRLQDLGNNRVKIIVCLPPKPDGTPDPIVWGLLRICVTRETDTNSPVITSVSPTSGRQGDLITIRGVNLPDDPAMACDLIVQPNGFIPLEAISASRTQIVARLGPVPPNAVPGRVVEALGTGGFGPFLPRFPDIVPLEPVWVLRRTTEPAATSPANFTPIFTTPPSGTTYYHGFVSNGVLCIFFTNPWPTNALVDIWGGIDDTNRPVHGELRAPQLRFTLGGSIRDCVERIADSLLCPFSQRAGLSLQKEVTVLPGSGVAKLTIRLRGGYIHKGFLIVCVRSARPRPTITSVTPLTVNAGGILTINGSGFGTDTNDQCVVIRNGGQVVPLRSISSTDGQVRAVVGEVPPNFGAGQVMLALGEGSEGGFTPAFPDMTVDAPAWTLQATELGAASQQLVTPIPRNPPQGTRWFFSQPAADGQICLFIVGSFPPCTRFQISGRFQTTGPAKDIDVDVPAFTWSSGGDWLDAAYRLCDGPVCALFQRLGVRIICSVDQAGTNTAKITVRYPEGEIVSGAFTVCAIPGPTKPVPVITEVLPRTAGEGEVITIRGRNFGNNPDNLCVVGRVGDTAVPMRALAATETQILARVGIVLTDLGPTRIMVGRGEGNVGRFTPAFPDIVLEDPSWVWRGFGQAGLDPGQFVAVPSQQRFGVEWFEGRVVDGRLCTYIRGNWAGNTLVQVTARAHTATEGIDADVPRTRFVGAGSTYECALRMKDIIVCAFRQQAQAEVNVEVIQQSDGRVKITVSRADGQAITWGLLTICVSQPVTFPEQFPVHMNINIARPCPPGAGNDLIDKMTDTAGNMVELRCQNGMYILRFIRPNGASKIIGKCVYPWGENAGWKFLDGAGRIQRVVWYNYEGHTGHDSGGPVHDVNGDGRENRDCYIYDVATDTLTVRKDDRGLNPNPQWPGFSHHGLPWDIQRVSNPRPAPTTLAALDLLFADLVGPAVPDGDYDAQTASLQLFGAIRGGGEVVLAINNYPIVVPTTRGMTPAQLAGQVARQFNQRWQQDQTQQGQQRQQQGKHATNDAVYPHIVDIRNALPDEMRVTILGEPELFYNHFAYPDQSVRLQGPATVHKNINIAEPCKPEPGNKLISRMTDASGNAVELRCENGSYHLYFIRPDGTRRAIGQCIYLWGENAGWKHLDERGNFTTVTWYNYEGHHGHDNNQCVHDSNHNPGKENRDCYIYDPATDRLKIRKDCRPLRNCRSDPGKPWQMLSMSPWRPAPEDVTGLHEAFSDFVDPDLPNGDYDAQISGIMFELRPGGRIRGGGRAVVTINDFPILVPTVANMTLTQLVSQVARQFNQQWQQSQTQQGQQQQQQGKSAIYTSSFPAVIDFRNALHEEIVVTLIDEPDVTVKPEVPCGGPLDIQREGDVIIISWEGGGTLQCATNIKGPWTPVTPDPESPYATSANEMMKFYRICCPEDPGR